MWIKTAILLAAMLSVACTWSEVQAKDATMRDPLEGWNRKVYAFNEGVDKAVLGPAAKGYRAITNKSIRAGISNFMTNLNQPIVFANAVFQGNPDAALDTLSRFMLNSTIGIVGIFDPATSIGVARHREDFGQTLGVWGVPQGAYLVLPVLGPSSVRDAFGIGIDHAVNPITWSEFEERTTFVTTTNVVGGISTRERLDDQIRILRDQPEPYTALRRNYVQQRAAAIRNGQKEEDPFADLPEFDAYEFSYE